MTKLKEARAELARERRLRKELLRVLNQRITEAKQRAAECKAVRDRFKAETDETLGRLIEAVREAKEKQ